MSKELFEITSRIVYSHQRTHESLEGSELDALLAFFRLRVATWHETPAYGQRRPESLSRIVLDSQGRAQRVPVPLPDWVWDRPDELSSEHPLRGSV